MVYQEKRPVVQWCVRIRTQWYSDIPGQGFGSTLVHQDRSPDGTVVRQDRGPVVRWDTSTGIPIDIMVY